ncbi:hypothetical protein DEJ27_08505 [Curtobacterium sp. MCPF17_018]|jgi:hypothetical protein|uniref:ABC-three component system middle component 8 n=1 Tax=Curtobacterium sp. MCPF17_018 TaxID=2175638 RepID=UPI000DAA620A|nr:hypothetical protein DEJ27_08505 [Curtobacterium sp. MCPF17_018]
MLKPSKHAHPDQTVLNISLILLEKLRAERVSSYVDLVAAAGKKVNSGDVLFMPAVNFLFILGLVEYRSKTDSFEYVGPNEAL